MRIPTLIAGILPLALVVAMAAGCDSPLNDNAATQKVNGSVRFAAGKAAGPAETVNGTIEIADDAAVTIANTVNGSVHLGARASAESLNAVNGSITVGQRAHVTKSIGTVNGGVTLGEGAEVAGPLVNVNGSIAVTAASVSGGIKTVTGNITITGASHIAGGIYVQKSSGVALIRLGSDIPRIIIGPGATVEGALRFEREVKLYVSDRAKVGPISGATAIAFAGEHPPMS